MYNLKVNLPHIVKSVDDFTSFFNEDFDINSKKTGNLSADAHTEQETSKKNTARDAEELLLNAQLLAAKQKELREVQDIKLLTNKILLEINQYHEQKRVYFQEILNQVTTLVMAIVEKIIQNKIKVDESFIAKIVTNALNSCKNEHELVIQVNPDDKNSLQKYWENIIQSQNHLAKIVLEENAAIKSGGCLIKTPNGSIDAQIENQLSVIEKVLIKHYSGVVYEHG